MNFESESPLLNFRAGKVSNLPSWFEPCREKGLKLIVGPGDYVKKGKTNIEEFIEQYDIFCCIGEEDSDKTKSSDYYVSVQENLSFLQKYLKKPETGKCKLMCIIDVYNKEQTENLIMLLRGNISLIEHQDTHTPIFNPDVCFELLTPGGQVILLMNTLEVKKIFNKEYYNVENLPYHTYNPWFTTKWWHYLRVSKNMGKVFNDFKINISYNKDDKQHKNIIVLTKKVNETNKTGGNRNKIKFIKNNKKTNNKKYKNNKKTKKTKKTL